MSNQNKQVQVVDFLSANQKSIEAYKAREYATKDFINSVALLVAENTTLQAAIQDPKGQAHFMQILKAAAKTGLSVAPRDGEAAIIAYNSQNLGTIIDYQIMKNGLIRLALESGAVDYIKSAIVCNQDNFEFAQEDGQTKNITHSFDIFSDRGPLVGAYAVMKLKNGDKYSYVANLKELEEIRAMSKMWQKDQKDKSQKSPWTNNFNGMAEKAVIKRVLTKNHIAALETTQRLIDENWAPSLPRDVTPKGMAPNEIPAAIEAARQNDHAEQSSTHTQTEENSSGKKPSSELFGDE